jgi:membrane fusion protein, multidrug efflux system
LLIKVCFPLNENPLTLFPKPNRAAYLLVGLLLLGITTGCEEKNTQTTSNQPPALRVKAEVARARALDAKYLTTAEILPFESVEIRTPVAGTVLNIAFKEGQYVQEGASIVRMDDRAWIAELSGVNTQLTGLKKELDRRENLFKIEGASEEEIDRLRTQIAQLESTKRQLELQISLANVKAPFSGVLGVRNFSTGAYLTQGSPIATLTQVNKLKAEFRVPDAFEEATKPGFTARIAAGKDTISAVVYASEPVIERTTRMRLVRAEISQPSGVLPGAFAEAWLSKKTNESNVVIPTQALIPGVENQTVFLYRSGKVLAQPVTPGLRDQTHCEILSGIVPGDTIITTGILLLRNGADVAIESLTDPEVNQ